jgi:acetyl-CoA acetyltransferase family protein
MSATPAATSKPSSKDGDALVIVSGARTPMAEYSGTKGYGRLKDVSAIDLGAVAAKAALERGKVPATKIDHVVFGNALQTSNDALYGARHVGLKAGVPETVPALTVNRICGSGLQSVVTGCEQIQLGRARTTLCGGIENMSQAPFVVHGAREGYRLGQNLQAEDLLFAALLDPFCGFFMAQTAENVAKDYGISRASQDEFALRSHRLGAAAVASGKFGEEIVPVQVLRNGKVVDTVTTDDHVKPDTTIEGLASLRPAFGKEGTVTAGNASGIVDGAAAVVVTTRGNAQSEGWPVLAEVVDWDVAGVPPRVMGMGPAPAIRGVVKRAGIRIEDVDLFEINEAFSAQYLGVEKELGLDREKVNVNGGAVALGHPLGATGTRLIYTLARELKARGKRWGIASACIGGGQGIAVLLRNPAA